MGVVALGNVPPKSHTESVKRPRRVVSRRNDWHWTFVQSKVATRSFWRCGKEVEAEVCVWLLCVEGIALLHASESISCHLGTNQPQPGPVAT